MKIIWIIIGISTSFGSVMFIMDAFTGLSKKGNNRKLIIYSLMIWCLLLSTLYIFKIKS